MTTRQSHLESSEVRKSTERSPIQAPKAKTTPLSEGRVMPDTRVGMIGILTLAGAIGCGATVGNTQGQDQDSGRDASSETRADTGRDSGRADTGRTDSGRQDSGTVDSGRDSGSDAGVDASDGGRCPVILPPRDGGVRDSGTDAGAPDANPFGCIDTDGENPHVRGHAMVGGMTYLDHCAGSRGVQEQVCNPYRPVVDQITLRCEFGETCVEGACVTIPAPTSTITVNNRIGDFLDRRNDDRVPHTDPTNTDVHYPFSTVETSDNANPFSDGMGGNLDVSETAMQRIDGSMHSGLSTRSIQDDTAANTYVENQNIWVRGDSRYSTTASQIATNIGFVAYTVKFSGARSSESGIPVCTVATADDSTACQRDGHRVDETANHRVQVRFMGEDYIITEMVPPTTATLDNPAGLVRGGSVTLAKEVAAAILNSGDAPGRTGPQQTLPMGDGLYLTLDAIEEHGGVQAAIISIYDADCNILKRDRIGEGETRTLIIGDKEYNVRINKLAPGYTLGARWADVQVLTGITHLVDGLPMNPDDAGVSGSRVVLGWKNLNGNRRAPQPDSLRMIGIYTDTVSAFSSNGSDELRTGDYLQFGRIRVGYRGVDLASTERMRVTFSIVNIAGGISSSEGPIGRDGAPVGCIVNAPYVLVITSPTNRFYQDSYDYTDEVAARYGRTLSNDQFMVALNGATCDRGHTMPPLSILMRESPSSTRFSGQFFPNIVLGSGVRFEPTIGWGQFINFALRSDTERESGLTLQRLLDTTGHGRACASGTCADAYVTVGERALDSRVMYDYMIFGMHNTHTGTPGDATFLANSAAADGFSITSDRSRMLYGHAVDMVDMYSGPSGPVTSGAQLVDESYVTERGSLIGGKAATIVNIWVARRLANAVLSFGL